MESEWWDLGPATLASMNMLDVDKFLEACDECVRSENSFNSILLNDVFEEFGERHE
jgi:hypothetical protein